MGATSGPYAGGLPHYHEELTMGWFSGSKDPVEREIKALKREKDKGWVDAKSSKGPDSPEWKAAEQRNKEINQRISKLEKGR